MALGSGELKVGFWIGIGIALAFLVWGLFQALLMKAGKRNG